MLPEYERRRLLDQFRSSFPKLEIELTNALSSIDLLDKSKVEEILKTFTNRLLVLQYDFKNSIQSTNSTFDVSRCTLNDSQIQELVAGLGLGVATAATLSFVTWTTATTTWFFWTTATTTTLGGLLGGALGVSAGIATGGAALLVGGATMFAVNQMRKKSRREHIKKQILDHWKNTIIPELEKWASKQIDSIG